MKKHEIVKPSKWIEHTNAAQPITEVACQALHDRLTTVWLYAPLAAKEWQEDVEHVHQLRVATRRARAALELFAELLPQRRVRWISKRLRELRRAAGDARDLDVLGGRLSETLAQAPRDSLNAVVKQIGDLRFEAQRPLKTAYKKAKRKKFPKRSRQLANAATWASEHEPTFAQAAPELLVPRVEEFFTAAQADLSDISALHQMRISGKRVRYAMELLAGAFDDSFRNDLYPTFGDIQDELGAINDHAVAIAMIGEWQAAADDKEIVAELNELIANEAQHLRVESVAFRVHWSDRRESDLRRRFAPFLKSVGAPKPHDGEV